MTTTSGLEAAQAEAKAKTKQARTAGLKTNFMALSYELTPFFSTDA